MKRVGATRASTIPRSGRHQTADYASIYGLLIADTAVLTPETAANRQSSVETLEYMLPNKANSKIFGHMKNNIFVMFPENLMVAFFSHVLVNCCRRSFYLFSLYISMGMPRYITHLTFKWLLSTCCITIGTFQWLSSNIFISKISLSLVTLFSSMHPKVALITMPVVFHLSAKPPTNLAASADDIRTDDVTSYDVTIS